MSSALKDCHHCGLRVPAVDMNEHAWEAVNRLAGTRPAMAAAELVALDLMSNADAKSTIEHLKRCVFSWPCCASLRPVLDEIDTAFLNVARPDHFTDFEHCSECRTHDETLQNRSVKTISRRDLGSTGWNPVAFMTPKGLAYYFPALARFAVIPGLSEGEDEYAPLLAPALSLGRNANDLLAYCNRSQRNAIASFIDWFAANEEGVLGSPFSPEDFSGGWANWADGAEVWRAVRPET